MTLQEDLSQNVKGEVRFGTGDRAIYANDSSNYRHVPLGVVIPHSVEDIALTVSICAKHGAPIVHRGGGTALAGQTISTNAVVIDSSKYCHTILAIDPEKKEAHVEPGVVLDDLKEAAKKYNLTFGPDPSTHNHNTLGGMIGNNSCGVHSVWTGRTVDNVESLEIMTYDGLRLIVGPTSDGELQTRMTKPGREGEIFRALKAFMEKYADEIRRTFPHLPRLVSGYRLEQLLPENGFHIARALVGTESTCVSVLRAHVRLVPDLEKALAILGFESLAYAADAVPKIVAEGVIACEALDDIFIEHMRKKHYKEDSIDKLPPGKAWLILQCGGKDMSEAKEKVRKLCDDMHGQPHLTSAVSLEDEQTAKTIWEIRKAGLPVTTWVPGQKRDTWEGWEDSAVPRDKLGVYVRELKALMAKHDYHAAMYGHFGDGLIHMRLDSGLKTDEEVRNFRSFMEEAADLVVSLGGSLSGEHGDGQSRSELLPKMYTPRIIQAFKEFKAIWDPQGKMNPGDKAEPVKKLDQDLRFGPAYKPAPVTTVFKYPESDGDFRRAALRCVGVGECRRKEEGAMCPSYRATLDEKHSTRGRARLFQEMFQGSPVSKGWKSEEVKDGLHLCLSCKSCKSECPVNVDMATYKSEFLYHYYEGKRRPLIHHIVGRIQLWARLANLLPGLPAVANVLMNAPILKKIVGIHRDRHVPKLALKTFRKRFIPDQRSNKHVILWCDTFNNYFTPHVLEATASVIRKAGYTATLSPENLCCGRPYYDYGLLTSAQKQLKLLVEQLTPELTGETWIVGVEPSCLATFKDELLNIFPNDPAAKKLSERTLPLAQFLEAHTDFQPAPTERKIVVHGHCHQKAVLGGMTADEKILKAVSKDVNILDSGCCGMAGSFGYEEDKYPVSKKIAGLKLLPAVRAAAADDIIVATGFSCRTQVAAFSDRNPLTLPEVLNGTFEERKKK
jgi:FAD/FMN-containing dehydrogenase/Fe-S oxidoreductase